MDIPLPPKPPPVRIIKEDCYDFCPKCGSSMLLDHWWKLWGGQ